MKNLRCAVVFAGLLAGGFLLQVLGSVADSQPQITSVEVHGTNIIVHASFPAGVRKLTLEGRNRVDGSAWVPRAVIRLDGNAGETNFEIDRSANAEILRLQASYSDLPTAFFKGTNSFATSGGASAGLPVSLDNAAGGNAPPDATRQVVESDIWQLDGDRLYFFNQYRGLQIMDVTDVNAPRIIGQVSLAAAGEQMYVVGGHHAVLLAQDSCNGSSNHVVIVDVTNSVPAIVASLPVAGWIQESRMVGTALYVASQDYHPSRTDASIWEYGTVVSSFDLADASNPIANKPLWFPAAYSTTVQATDRFLFVITSETWTQSTVQIIDISEPNGSMELVSKAAAAGRIDDKFKIHLDGDVLTTISMRWGGPGNTASILETFSLKDPRNPQALGSLELGKGEQLHATQFDGNRVYLVTFYRVDPLWIVDLSDPTQPKISGELQVPGWSTYIKPLGDRLVTIGIDPTNQWRVTVSLFDVADATAPAVLSRVALGENNSWSEATYDEKAFNVLSDAGLILVPYSGYLTNGYAQRLQLIDLGRDTLKLRGAIEHDIAPRRATVHRESVLSLSGRDLLSVDISDRDNPVVKADLALSWTVDRVLVKGDFLIEVENGGNWYYQYAQPTLRVCDSANADHVLNTITLSNGWPIVGADMRGSFLYVAQTPAMAQNWWYLPLAIASTAGDAPTNGNAVLLTTALDLGSLPNLNPSGSAQTELTNAMSSVSDLQPLWPRENLLVWASTASYFPWIFMGIDMIRPGFWPPWGGYGGAEFYAIDVAAPGSPQARATLDLSSNVWSFSKALTVNGLIYLSHQNSDYIQWPIVPLARVLNETNAIKSDPTNVIEPVTNIWVNRYYLDVVDFADSQAPVVRKPVNIPGSLTGTSHDGAVLYTTGTHWTTNDTYSWIEWLDASAYDGVSAYLVDSTQLSDQWPHPVSVFGDKICIGVPATTNAPNQLQVLALGMDGKFKSQQVITLDQPVQQLDVIRKFLLVENGANVALYTNSVTGIAATGGSTESSCYYYFQANRGTADDRGVWLPLGDYGVLKASATLQE